MSDGAPSGWTCSSRDGADGGPRVPLDFAPAAAAAVAAGGGLDAAHELSQAPPSQEAQRAIAGLVAALRGLNKGTHQGKVQLAITHASDEDLSAIERNLYGAFVQQPGVFDEQRGLDYVAFHINRAIKGTVCGTGQTRGLNSRSSSIQFVDAKTPDEDAEFGAFGYRAVVGALEAVRRALNEVALDVGAHISRFMTTLFNESLVAPDGRTPPSPSAAARAAPLPVGPAPPPRRSRRG